MALNRDKFRNIVGGITTAEPEASPAVESVQPPPRPITPKTGQPSAGQGRKSTGENESSDHTGNGEHQRFAKRGRPKGRKDEATDKTRKVKVSLFLSEVIVNDLYDWAHDDKMHPGEMFERALRPFHEKEAKRRNAGKE